MRKLPFVTDKFTAFATETHTTDPTHTIIPFPGRNKNLKDFFSYFWYYSFLYFNGQPILCEEVCAYDWNIVSVLLWWTAK